MKNHVHTYPPAFADKYSRNKCYLGVEIQKCLLPRIVNWNIDRRSLRNSQTFQSLVFVLVFTEDIIYVTEWYCHRPGYIGDIPGHDPDEKEPQPETEQSQEHEQQREPHSDSDTHSSGESTDLEVCKITSQ